MWDKPPRQKKQPRSPSKAPKYGLSGIKDVELLDNQDVIRAATI